MKIAVWDTYVKKEDNEVMHFDILIPSTITNEQTVYNFGEEYLKTKPFKTEQLTSNECQFCHIEQATEDMMLSINKLGYYIIEIKNCH